ncbi:hypothetical protein D7V97_43105, partial [Corallococcus sp. CA053C]
MGPEAEEVRLGMEAFGLLSRVAGPGGMEHVLFPRAAWGNHLTRARLAQVLGFVETKLSTAWTARFAPEGSAASHFHVRLGRGAEPFRVFTRLTEVPVALPVQRGQASAGLVRGWG